MSIVGMLVLSILVGIALGNVILLFTAGSSEIKYCMHFEKCDFKRCSECIDEPQCSYSNKKG